MNCEDVPSGEDWGDVTDAVQEALEEGLDAQLFSLQEARQTTDN